MKQVHLEWVIEEFIHKLHVILFSRLMFFLQDHERTTTSIGKNDKKKLNLSRIMQLYFAHKQLLKRQFLFSLLIFVHGIQLQLNGLQKRDTG